VTSHWWLLFLADRLDHKLVLSHAVKDPFCFRLGKVKCRFGAHGQCSGPVQTTETVTKITTVSAPSLKCIIFFSSEKHSWTVVTNQVIK